MSILDRWISPKEKKLQIFVYLIWGLPFFCTIFRGFAKIGAIDEYINPFIIITCLLVALNQITAKIRTNDFVVYIACAILYLLTYVLFPENEEYLNQYAFSFLLLCLPYLFYGKLIDINEYKDNFYKISVCVIFFFIWYLFRYMQTKAGSMEDQGIQEYMYFAYQALPHVLYVVWYALMKPSVMRLFFAGVGIFLLSSLGTRGTLICVLFFVLFYLLVLNNYTNKKKKYITWSIAIIVVSVIAYFLNDILLGLQFLLGELGMSTRIFDMLLDSDFIGGESVDERDDLISLSTIVLKDHPLFGVGIAGSFVSIKNYPHNLLYDCWLTFGYTGGTALFLYMVYLIISAYKKTVNVEEKGFLLVLISCGFISYFLSRTYLAAPDIFFLLGYCVFLNRKYKRI